MFRVLVALTVSSFAHGCTNLLLTHGSTVENATTISYNADAASLYGFLYHYPATTNAEGAMRDIYEWDTGKYLGQIAEVPTTYNVIGNVNEFGVIIGETTYGGLADLQHQSKAKMDYGSLIWVTLQRSKSAREAIMTLDSLMQEYGYYSEGESFSIGDQKELWIMEIIGKGEYELGSVWVAVRIPDGSIAGHANQARITTFDQNDSSNVLYSSDVITFARSINAFDGEDADFSFSDVYDPVTFSGARFCESRVWDFFSTIMGQEFSDEYKDYAMGLNLTNRMPLYVTPAQKIPLEATFAKMRAHYEGTALDMSGESFPDLGAEDSYSPYRAHPLTWSSGGQTYLNERPIGTQQTGWNFVAQSRSWMPRELAAVMWFGVDDSSTTVRIPFYGSTTAPPPSFAGKGPQDGVVAPMMTFDPTKAFYAFNLVANWAYSRWNLMYPDVLAEIERREMLYLGLLEQMDQKAVAVYESEGAEKAVELVTTFSKTLGEELVRDWYKFFGELFVRYRDGYRTVKNDDELACGCTNEAAAYPQPWYDRIASENGAHFQVDPASSVSSVQRRFHRKETVSKIELLSKR